MSEQKEIVENYQRIVDDDRSFDIQYWQAQGPLAIFEAVEEMVKDYCLLRGIDPSELKIDRTVEHYSRWIDAEH